MASERLAQIGGHLSGSLPPFELTVDQREQYERDGFIIAKGLLSDEEISQYTGRFSEVCMMDKEEVKKLPYIVMRDVGISKTAFKPSENSITKLQDWSTDERLFDFCRHPKVMAYVRNFTGPRAKAIHTMYINKPPDIGTGTSRHPLHQDLWYFPYRPPDRIVCAWAALETINRENGCLTVVPGSHKEFGLLKHGYPDWEGGVNGMYHGIELDKAVSDQRVYLHMSKGDVVFFHPLLIHGSGRNSSQGFRKAISCHYTASDLGVVDPYQTGQKEIAEEIVHTFGKRLGLKTETMTEKEKAKIFMNVWDFKSREIR